MQQQQLQKSQSQSNQVQKQQVQANQNNFLNQQEKNNQKKIPGKNVPLFIGTRLKNCLRFDCPIKRQVQQMIEQTGQYKYEDFLKWLDDPLMKLKEIWHFQITWTIYAKESQQEKFFKQIFKKASVLFLENYAVNSIIWSGQSQHSLTVSNSNVKKPAVLKKIGKFMQAINNTDKLRGMFNEKKDETSQQNNNSTNILSTNQSQQQENQGINNNINKRKNQGELQLEKFSQKFNNKIIKQENVSSSQSNDVIEEIQLEKGIKKIKIENYENQELVNTQKVQYSNINNYNQTNNNINNNNKFQNVSNINNLENL
ncbi:hypothetical protein PPERSA_04476 [Pseudocohnilembus persalinus]|uniref:Uncharacterized protein n=1 Tax=Pseudocohnilembus persalinus TaxID=266149 RepID=A0A0V0QRU3_PSEPJ|nr:hypothetical protein PPERSA_04476 [Pseudocohnilembus persalinus]|eukprot:KRX04661.1 hypothetical protein PPERSA_04476 [Pseudocohnilembus persalinus]